MTLCTLSENQASSPILTVKVANTATPIVGNKAITVKNEKSFSNYENYHPNDSTGHFVFVLQAGHNYHIEFKIDDLMAFDTINVPENEFGIHEYTKVVEIKEKEILIAEGVDVDGDIIDNETLSQLSKNNQSTLQVFETPKKLKVKSIIESTNNFVLKNPDTAVVDVKMEDKHILFYNNIYFKTESSDISNSEKSKLDLLIKELRNNPSWTINSIGHTDSKGSVRYNQILSSLRSESVKTYLCNRGISYKRVHTIGKGESFPIAENVASDGSDNASGRESNRRVELQIIK